MKWIREYDIMVNYGNRLDVFKGALLREWRHEHPTIGKELSESVLVQVMSFCTFLSVILTGCSDSYQ